MHAKISRRKKAVPPGNLCSPQEISAVDIGETPPTGSLSNRREERKMKLGGELHLKRK